ncbi:hypothetical protein Tco_0748658 [Tanacetum coccineum]|uniref:Uncharacterized protein n=1 Tax=Tanacetum coccineum TaxID=301880 RepID=A0ABQ4YYZ7_9ASTR
MRMERYIQMVDYSLWEVIENGNAPPITKVIEGVETTIAPTTRLNKWANKRHKSRAKEEATFIDGIHNATSWKSNDTRQVKGTSSSSTNTQNVAFVSSNNTSSTNGEVNTGYVVTTASTQATNFHGECIQLPQQMGTLCKRARLPRNKKNKIGGNTRRVLPVENNTTNALISCDGLGDYDWSDQTEEGPTNFALMAYSSTSSNSKEEDVPQAKKEKKIVKSSFAKIKFVKSKEQVKSPRKITVKQGSGPNWLFDIDTLTKSMNYKPVVAGNQSNGNVGTKACDDVDDYEDVGAKADIKNLNTFMPVNPIPTTRIHKDHPVEQIIRDLHSTPQTRRMTKNLKEHGKRAMQLNGSSEQDGGKRGIMTKEHSSDGCQECFYLYGKDSNEEVYCNYTNHQGFKIQTLPDRSNKVKRHVMDLQSISHELRLNNGAASKFCGHSALRFKSMLDYGYNYMHTKIYINNESTICIVKNPVFHSKIKHIEIRLRDSNEKKLIQMIKIHTDKNVADLLTKAV